MVSSMGWPAALFGQRRPIRFSLLAIRRLLKSDHVNVTGTDAVLSREFSNRDATLSLSREHFPGIGELLASASNALGPVG